MDDARGLFAAAAALREGRGIRLEEISHSTRIAIAYLRAIESLEFECLPGGAYNLSYIRQYAQAIEFDEDALVRAYRSLNPPTEFVRQPSRWQAAGTAVAARLRHFRQRIGAALARQLPH